MSLLVINFIFVFIFTALISVQRVHETFFSKGRIRGEIIAGWTLTAMSIVHALIIFFSFVEFCVIKRNLNWALTVVGIFFYLMALLVRSWCIKIQGSFYSANIEIRDHHPLFEKGPYAIVRHPVYLVTFFELLSIPMVLNAPLVAVFTVGIYYPLLIIRMNIEEKVLRTKFGDRYLKYSSAVPMIVPNFGLGKFK